MWWTTEAARALCTPTYDMAWHGRHLIAVVLLIPGALLTLHRAAAAAALVALPAQPLSSLDDAAAIGAGCSDSDRNAAITSGQRIACTDSEMAGRDASPSCRCSDVVPRATEERAASAKDAMGSSSHANSTAPGVTANARAACHALVNSSCTFGATLPRNDTLTCAGAAACSGSMDLHQSGEPATEEQPRRLRKDGLWLLVILALLRLLS
jgi:hypothetical protein